MASLRKDRGQVFRHPLLVVLEVATHSTGGISVLPGLLINYCLLLLVLHHTVHLSCQLFEVSTDSGQLVILTDDFDVLAVMHSMIKGLNALISTTRLRVVEPLLGCERGR